jgi:hypothetical protein
MKAVHIKAKLIIPNESISGSGPYAFPFDEGYELNNVWVNNVPATFTRSSNTVTITTTQNPLHPDSITWLETTLYYADKPFGDSVRYYEAGITGSGYAFETDVLGQQTSSIEGKGSITLLTESVAQLTNFIFENQEIELYSVDELYNKTIEFRGLIREVKYSNNKVTFTYTNLLASLKDAYKLNNYTQPHLEKFKRRAVYNEARDLRAICLDDGKNFGLTGTITLTQNSNLVTGSGTQFLSQLYQNDELFIDGGWYSIASISSNTQLTLQRTWDKTTQTFSGVLVRKRTFSPRQHRVWNFCQGPVRQPTTTILNASTASITVADSSDIKSGDYLWFPSLNAHAYVNNILGSIITLSSSLPIPPSPGSQVIRPFVQKLRVKGQQDEVLYEFYYGRHFTTDPVSGNITFFDHCEVISPPYTPERIPAKLTWTNNSRTVAVASGDVGSVGIGDWLRAPNGDYYEAVELNEGNVFIRVPYTGSNASNQDAYKISFTITKDSEVYANVYGKINQSGKLMREFDEILKDVLDEPNVQMDPSFGYFDLPIVIGGYRGTKNELIKNLADLINSSTFGFLHQDRTTLDLAYSFLRPKAPVQKFIQQDFLDLNVEYLNSTLIGRAICNYAVTDLDSDGEFVEASSVIGSQIVETGREKSVKSLTTNSTLADITAKRWARLLNRNSVKVIGKLKKDDLNSNVTVGSTIECDLKLYGISGLFIVESLKFTDEWVEIEAINFGGYLDSTAIWDQNQPWYDPTQQKFHFF